MQLFSTVVTKDAVALVTTELYFARTDLPVGVAPSLEKRMSLSLFDVSVPVVTRALKNLSRILDKAAAHATAKKIDTKVLVDARLIADMLPLSRQVQIACDTAKSVAGRLAGVEVPKHEDNETTMDELQARIAKTLAFVATVKPEQFADAATREVVLKFPNMTLNFNGQSYLTSFAIPNFFFHVTMAYAILRQNGVEIGKPDFIGNVQ